MKCYHIEPVKMCDFLAKSSGLRNPGHLHLTETINVFKLHCCLSWKL